MVLGTMTEHYERRHKKWLLYLLLMRQSVWAVKNVLMSVLPKFSKWLMKNHHLAKGQGKSDIIYPSDVICATRVICPIGRHLAFGCHLHFVRYYTLRV